jgi:hypothetical protein
MWSWFLISGLQKGVNLQLPAFEDDMELMSRPPFCTRTECSTPNKCPTPNECFTHPSEVANEGAVGPDLGLAAFAEVLVVPVQHFGLGCGRQALLQTGEALDHHRDVAELLLPLTHTAALQTLDLATQGTGLRSNQRLAETPKKSAE